MDAAYFSIALAGATDLCSRSADLTITAAEEDDTYYEYYGTTGARPARLEVHGRSRCAADPAPSRNTTTARARSSDRFSPVLYILETIIELGGDFYVNGGNRSRGCLPCM